MSETYHLTSKEDAARNRLIEAASDLLRQGGIHALNVDRVTKEAGVEPSTFHLYFNDMAALLKALAEIEIELLRRSVRSVRKRLHDGWKEEPLRDNFQVPMESLLNQPDLVLFMAQEYHQPLSPLGVMAKSLQEELRNDLIEDLIELGMPATSRAEHERLSMISEGLILLTEALTLSYHKGRYTHREEVVETLVSFARGVISDSLASNDRPALQPSLP
jgi:AcrR family transcriptional regulator